MDAIGLYGGKVTVDGPDVLVTSPNGTTAWRTINKSDLEKAAYGEVVEIPGFLVILTSRTTIQIEWNGNRVALDLDELKAILR